MSGATPDTYFRQVQDLTERLRPRFYEEFKEWTKEVKENVRFTGGAYCNMPLQILGLDESSPYT